MFFQSSNSVTKISGCCGTMASSYPQDPSKLLTGWHSQPPLHGPPWTLQPSSPCPVPPRACPLPPTLLRAFLTHVPITQGQRTGGLVPPVATRGPLVMAVGSRCVGAFYLGAGSGAHKNYSEISPHLVRMAIIKISTNSKCLGGVGGG